MMTDCYDATSRMSSAQGKHPYARADSCMMSATFWGVGPPPPVHILAYKTIKCSRDLPYSLLLGYPFPLSEDVITPKAK